jgi:hypothetical protein
MKVRGYLLIPAPGGKNYFSPGGKLNGQARRENRPGEECSKCKKVAKDWVAVSPCQGEIMINGTARRLREEERRPTKG